MNAPLDDLHQQCLAARGEIRASFERLRSAALAWEMAACPPAPVLRLRPLSVWLDDRTAVPVTRPEPEPYVEIWDADDPLLRPCRWLG